MILKGEGFEIRPLTTCKLDAAAQVYRQADGGRVSSQTVLEDMTLSQQAGGVFCGIFDRQDELVGVLDFIPANYAGRAGDACIRALKIAAPYRGRGYASKAVKRLEEELRKDGQARRLWACFVGSCPTRRAFAMELGFRPVEEGGDILVKNLA
ncbi:MAG: GNAT family N-acetyltransferase [Anaerolineae bacterium]|nr:GNAT family N-acetyltransferase [Anaerolineae bacterium]